MRELLAGWIIFQLVLIGIAGATMYNEIVTGTYECNPVRETVSVWGVMVCPLMFFLPDQAIEMGYCETQDNLKINNNLK